MLGTAPDVLLAALVNREFLRRAVRYLAAGRGIGQFVDIGPGLPTQGNVHQLAHRHDPGAKVAYVDNDASVLVHGRALLDGVPGVTVIPGDLREPDRSLAASPRLSAARPPRAFLDLGAVLTAPGCARAWTRQILREWGLPGLAGDAEAIVSELADSVNTSRGLDGAAVRLILTFDRGELAILVRDEHPGVPRARHPGADDEAGR